MKYLSYISLILIVSVCVGCEKNREIATIQVTPTTETIEIPQVDSFFSEKDFYNFFKAYFSLTEEEILSVNKNYEVVDSQYWGHLQDYKAVIINKLGDYLCEEMKQKLEEQYLTNEIHLPKKLLINEYITYGSATVESLEIISMRQMGEDMVYEIGVTTCNDVQKLSDFQESYVWVPEVNYYDLKSKVLNGEAITLERYSDASSKALEADIMYAVDATEEEKDKIKLLQKYWVKVAPGRKLKIKGIQEADTLSNQERTRGQVSQSEYVTRLAYYNKVSEEERLLIQKIFGHIMCEGKMFYEYYDKAMASGYNAVKLFWEDVGLLDTINITPESYKQRFETTINPYKDNIIGLTLLPEVIEVIPSLYSTKMQPRFIVNLPIKALLSNNEIVYYKYKYFVGMDENKVEFITFMNMESLTEENYNESVMASTQSSTIGKSR